MTDMIDDMKLDLARRGYGADALEKFSLREELSGFFGLISKPGPTPVLDPPRADEMLLSPLGRRMRSGQ